MSSPTAESDTTSLAARAGAFPANTVDVLSKLTAQQLEDYERDGYLVIRDWVTRDQLLALQSSAEAILDAFDPSAFRSVFTTSAQEKVVDDYMLDSGDQVRCFFEADAFDANGDLRYAKNKSINKIGHALHERDPAFRAYSASTPFKQLCASLGMQDPRLAQSMYIFKQPFIGGKVGAHQDSAFLYTEPQTCVGLWVALDDATRDNGCMYAVPGSHKAGLRTRYRLRTETNAETGEVTRKTYFTPPVAETDLKMEGGVCLDVPAGSLVVLHGALVHYSFENKSAAQRHAYTLHVVDGGAEWAKDNWMQREEPFPGF